MDQLTNANRRFVDGAASCGLEVMIVQMANSTRTAKEAAAACGCAVGQIVKSLIFRGSETDAPYLLLVSGTKRVEQKGVAAQIGEELLRPDADYVRDVTGYAIGGVPPLAHKTLLKTFIDRDLLAFETVWAAAGTSNSMFSAKPAALCKAAKAHVIDVN